MQRILMAALTVALSLGVLADHAFGTGPFAFSVDRFRVVGNIPGDAVDEFEDGVLAPWLIDSGTAIESNGVVTLSGDGEGLPAFQSGHMKVFADESAIRRYNTNLGVTDGAGNFAATSTWVYVVPGEDQAFSMCADII